MQHILLVGVARELLTSDPRFINASSRQVLNLVHAPPGSGNVYDLVKKKVQPIVEAADQYLSQYQGPKVSMKRSDARLISSRMGFWEFKPGSLISEKPVGARWDIAHGDLPNEVPLPVFYRLMSITASGDEARVRLRALQSPSAADLDLCEVKLIQRVSLMDEAAQGGISGNLDSATLRKLLDEMKAYRNNVGNPLYIRAQSPVNESGEALKAGYRRLRPWLSSPVRTLDLVMRACSRNFEEAAAALKRFTEIIESNSTDRPDDHSMLMHQRVGNPDQVAQFLYSIFFESSKMHRESIRHHYQAIFGQECSITYVVHSYVGPKKKRPKEKCL